MTTLTEFLTARLGEDEALAEAATAGPWRYNPGKHYRREWTVEFEESVFAGPPGDDANSIALTGESDDPQSMADADHIARHDPARVLREVAAKRAILARESIVELPEWKPDCGGDWVLSGTGFFANYWPDNTVTASITDGFDGPALADSGIVPKESRAACQLFAEEWIRQHLPERSPILRDLAAPYSNHPDFDSNWSTT